VQPLFLENPQARIPELARVAVVMGERTAFDRTLTGALGQLLDIRVPDSLADEDRGGDDGDADTADDALSLLERAIAAFGRADALLREGNLAGYQREILAARDLLERAFEASGGSLVPDVPEAPEAPEGGADDGETAQTTFVP
jgi:uncharacterized membrane protein (UPF0182 family)